MGRKLSKNELKRIVQIAKIERQKKGVKSVEKKVNYNLKWREAIKIAALSATCRYYGHFMITPKQGCQTQIMPSKVCFQI